MLQQKNNDNPILFGALVLLFAALVAIAAGIFIAKIVRRYSRSYLLAYSWLLLYFCFLYFGFTLGEDKGSETGFEVMAREYLFGVDPLLAFLGVLMIFLSISFCIYFCISADGREEIRREREIDAERIKASSGLTARLAVLCGAGILGVGAGYRIGRNL